MVQARPRATPEPASTRRTAELHLATAVARRHFLEDRTRTEIADELGISRFKVARLIELARAEGLVRIEITEPVSDAADALAAALEERYGLVRARVVEGGADAARLLDTLGAAGAAVLDEVVEPGSRLGMSWGRTVGATVDALDRLPDCTVVQVAGGAVGSLEDSAVELVRRAAGRTTSGSVQVLHAPLFVPRADTARQLRAQPQLAATLALHDRLDAVLLGVGTWNPETALASGLSAEDRARLERQGAVAEVCGQFLGPDGRVLTGDVERRTVAIRLDQLRAVPRVVGIAGGRAKAPALRAVLRAGLLTHLVTDIGAAEAALD